MAILVASVMSRVSADPAPLVGPRGTSPHAAAGIRSVAGSRRYDAGELRSYKAWIVRRRLADYRPTEASLCA